MAAVRKILLRAAGISVLNDGIAAYGAGLYELATERLLPLANSSDALAELILGKTYVEPFNTSRDCEVAEYWPERSSEHGNAEAGFELGYIYDTGVCGEEDKLVALEWYLQSFEKGWSPAAAKIGELYLKQWRLFERMAQARRWLTCSPTCPRS